MENVNMYILVVIWCVLFMTSDNIYEFVSIMGSNLTPYSVGTDEKNYYLLAPNFELIEKHKIDYNTILDGKYAPDSDLPFEGMELCKIHSNYEIQQDLINSNISCDGCCGPNSYQL